MFREEDRTLKRVILETGLKIFTQLDDESIRGKCRTAIDNWRRLIEDAEIVSVLLWIGDGDEVFNFTGDMNAEFKWNDCIGFNNLQYNAYPESRHYRTWFARPYIENPPKFTPADLKRVISIFKATAREMCGVEIQVGTTIDAGPEFVESKFKFERHPELLKGGPNSEMPKSLSFLCCYAHMNGDDYPYAGFPGGLPQGTHFGTFLGRQLRLFSEAVGLDYVWLSNGFGLTHYAWNYVGEVFNGLEYHPELAPESIKQFVSFWEEFRKEYPSGRIDIRGTNYSIGMDATSHGIDIREIYRRGQLITPAPNPPWGSANLGLEMASHLSRISSTPTRSILFRYYINDSWFAGVPWYDYYNREPFDVYCPLACTRLNDRGEVEGATDMSVMTVNTGFGEMPKTQASEVEPHVRRAFNLMPDEAGPLVWVYPFSEYQDELHRPNGQIQKSFFGDWYIARAIDAGLPLNTVITTDNFAKVVKDNPKALAGRILIVPTPAADWKYAAPLIDFVKAGGKAILYGSLHDAPKELLKLLNVKLDTPVDGDLDVTMKMAGDEFEVKGKKRPLRHIGRICDGGVCEQVADKSYKCTSVRATVGSGGKRRVYALVRKSRAWKGGQVAWIRGSLPFDAQPISLEPILFAAEESHDATEWVRFLLADFGMVIRQSRHDAATKAISLFASRSRGRYVINGHKRDATTSVQLSFPDGAPLLSERQARIKKSAATYCLDRTFHSECFAFVRQEAESLVSYKEQRTVPGEHRTFDIHGLKDAVVTLYVSQDAVANKTLKVRRIVPYTIQDPTAEDRFKKKYKVRDLSELERDLTWKVDPVTGGVVVEKTSGSIHVRW
ncbi:MAG: hypothetical protein JXL80_11355 [Planctomycetes bacterium]|nr:hypothetical protein [Planctomycetota bacterium]